MHSGTCGKPFARAGEESVEQIGSRAERMGLMSNANIFLYSATRMEVRLPTTPAHLVGESWSGLEGLNLKRGHACPPFWTWHLAIC